jgi:hypothetical protein
MPDLSQLDTQAPAEEGIDVELEHPYTGEPIVNDDGTPWIIKVRGEDSATVVAVSKKQRNRISERIRKRGQVSGAEEAEAAVIEKIVAATIGWKGLIMDGKPYEFSPQAAHSLYSDPRFPWVADQVFAAMVDRRRFFSKG